MNRSILIVICDFLLVSLLVFSTPDISKLAKQRSDVETAPISQMTTNQGSSAQDLTAVMRQALEEERKNREQLLGELARTRATASEREQQVQRFQQDLQSREQQAQMLQQQLQSREREAQQLQQQQSVLQQQFVTTQTNLLALSQQVQSSSTEAAISKERLAAMEAEVKKRSEEAAALQKQLAQLAQSNQVVVAEQQKLAGQLQVAEVEKRHATEQVNRMQEEVKTERAEKAKLVENVKSLASKSGELAQEVRENRPLTPNTIYNEFLTNRVEARFNFVKPGLLGESNKRRDTETVLVSDGTNTYAMCHVQDTPLTLWNPGMEWDALSGSLIRGSTVLPIRSLSFCLQDPRIVFVSVTPAEARQLGGKPYRISASPYKFQDAVLIGTTDNYYGECRFEIDPATPEYVRLDRSFLRGLFGKFNPSRGDLVFSKTGDLLGIMANGSYCMMIHNFNSAATFRFAQDTRDQHTGTVLSWLFALVQQLPPKVQ
jgi:hypothetical protein